MYFYLWNFQKGDIHLFVRNFPAEPRIIFLLLRNCASFWSRDLKINC